MRIDYFNAKPIDDIRGFAYNMMIGSKGPSDALARSLETLIDPPNTNGVVIFHRKMTRAVSVPAAHCTRSVRAADHQLGAKYLLTPAS